MFHPLTDFFPLAGFYFPDVSAAEKYYNGSILEEEYEKKLMVKTRQLIFIYSRKKQLHNNKIVANQHKRNPSGRLEVLVRASISIPNES